ncbi:MAG TPA: amidase family protein [Rhodanobacteraceae bacterium]|nr:amidase family protein [Rhodanobacteraceae bacterium]
MRLQVCKWLMLLAALPAAAAEKSTTFDLATATIADINAAIDAGALSSERLVELYLARIAAYDRQGPKLNSVITLNEHALDEARALDRERLATGRRSALHGIPVVLKDLIDAAGMPTTAGFKPFGAPIPPRDAHVTTRLKASGAIILAKVATVNWFGLGFDETHPIGASLNPYALDRSPGGSSNGPGVSMAAYFATVAIGTDTGGSVRIPSAYNSIFGMVATQGLVSRAGIVPRGATQDRAGPMGRSVYDLAATLAVISGWDAEDAATSSGFGHFPAAAWADKLDGSLVGRRIGVLREMIDEGPAHEQGRALFERALEDLRAAGAVVIDIRTGLDLKALASSAIGRTAEYEKLYVQNAYLARLGPAAKFATVQEMIVKVGRDKFSRLMLAALDLPPPAESPDYLARLEHRAMLISLATSTVDELALDALVLPFSTRPPPLLDGSGDGGGGGQSLASNNGLPSIVAPAGYTDDGLPIAVEFVGKPFADRTLLEVVHGYESASRRRVAPSATPPLSGERFSY